MLKFNVMDEDFKIIHKTMTVFGSEIKIPGEKYAFTMFASNALEVFKKYNGEECQLKYEYVKDLIDTWMSYVHKEYEERNFIADKYMELQFSLIGSNITVDKEENG